jgi:serine/threonine protein kinase
MVGTVLNHYRLESKLGEGGMGVVYKATDSHLGREVALKLLREPFLEDAGRLARLKREARALASLNHSNIAAIHGLEEVNGTHFLVLEYAPGETLEHRISDGPLPLREALDIARQVAEGIEAAHEKEIIHRDLKPANIKVAEDGRVKVLDFGLAKALEPPTLGEMDQTVTAQTAATQPGMVLGTAPYMSPEQACARAVDTRTDIWSFGCVLYEMLTGKRAFQGATTTEVMAAILQGEPDWGALPVGTPQNILCLLRRCLHKEVRGRQRHIGDARIELEDTLAGRIPATTAPADSSRGRLVLAAALAGILLGVAATAAWVWNRARSTTPPPVVRFAFDLPQGQLFTPTWNPNLTFSPDAEILAYSTRTGVGPGGTFLRRLNDLDSKPLSSAPNMTIPTFLRTGAT